ncbi:uncharacterized protein LOC115681213 [Syzygium oleosum]|uniref:uncharacterized protein LOC115681213 n=1 Tax=Syzygium oleosum TaxID=219896 RepID=UPI0011D2A25F|nr:uncharacterized protein LOC115681213 [Syzygium oleosum]
MDSDRPHRTTSINSSSSSSNSTGELFICFTSRLSSSSSMKISKSILSPGRARDHQTPQISLSSSLSRRLRSNGSLKGAGQASPMFPANGKKRGSTFENPEPSSPKVTCIGQVRVKTKKQGKKLRARSKRGGGGGEVSFRKLEISNGATSTEATQSFYFQNQQGNNQECLPHRNQRWVHFPVTICEALRTFGADWNCFLPCRSSCMSKEEKTEGGPNNGENGDSGNHNSSSCGAVIARWLVAMQEGEGRGREVEIIVGDEERTTAAAAAAAAAVENSGSYRRRAFEGIEFNEEEICRERSEVEEDDGGARASVCIPPKNALLLMRCRSDPVKMAALASRFCEAPPAVVDDNDEDENQSENFVASGRENEGVEVKRGGEVEHEMDDDKEEEVSEKWVSAEASLESRVLGEWSSNVEEREDGQEVNQPVNVLEEQLDQKIMEEEDEEEVKEVLVLDEEEEEGEEKELMEVTSQVVTMQETELRCFAVPDGESLQLSVQDHTYTGEGEAHHEHGAESDDGDHDNDVMSVQLSQESEGDEEHETESEFHVEVVAPTEDALGLDPETRVTVPHKRSESDGLKPPRPEVKLTEREGTQQKSVLPDCLLLMMCEPKLSMEVSKETWVCSTDFIRWLPERHVGKVPVKTDGGKDEPKKRAGNAESKRAAAALTAQQAHILQQPRRNSCSLPPKAAARAAGAESMATMIEQKLESAKAYEPCVLTRCKSEPMRSATKLAPDACFWKNRKLEPHRPATHGVKAAGVGF